MVVWAGFQLASPRFPSLHDSTYLGCTPRVLGSSPVGPKPGQTPAHAARMVHSGPPSRQSSPLIDASMRPPLRSSRPAATSRRSALGIAAALACILVVLLRGETRI